MWTRFDRDVVRHELRMAREVGLDTLRWFLYWPDFEPAPRVLPDGPWQSVELFLNEAHAAGLHTWPTLLVGHMSGQNWDPPWRAGRDLWEDPWMVEETAWWVAEAVRRLGPHPAVFGFVLTNEWPLYAGPTRVAVARAWLERITRAVRDADPGNHPLSLGDGLWSSFGAPNGITREMLVTYTDILGPHVYPEGPDGLAVALTSYEAVRLAQGPRPVLLEEFGTTDGFGSRESQARYYRSVLAGTLLGGGQGAWAWCLTDFPLPMDAPYSHHPFELRFGLFTETGDPKPTAAAMTRFRPVADAFGEVETDPVAVLVPAVQTGDLPFPRGPEAPVVTLSARLLLRELLQVGFNPAVLHEPMPDLGSVPQEHVRQPALAPFKVILVACPRIGEPLRQQLWDWVAAGGTLYVAYSDTGWWPDPEALLGVRLTGPYGLRPRVEGTVAAVVAGQRFTVEARGLPFRHAESAGAAVWGYLDDAPVLFRRPWGQGQIFVSMAQLEICPGPHAATVSTVLQAGHVDPPVRLEARGLQAGRSRDGQLLVVNHGEDVAVWNGLAASGTPCLTLAGEPLTEPVVLPPHDWWWGRLPGSR